MRALFLRLFCCACMGQVTTVRFLRDSLLGECTTISVCLFFFFFSSRRRHTRSDRDWSSDVCSSDLYVDLVQLHEALEGWERRLEQLHTLQEQGKALGVGLCNATHHQLARALEIADRKSVV